MLDISLACQPVISLACVLKEAARRKEDQKKRKQEDKIFEDNKKVANLAIDQLKSKITELETEVRNGNTMDEFQDQMIKILLKKGRDMLNSAMLCITQGATIKFTSQEVREVSNDFATRIRTPCAHHAPL